MFPHITEMAHRMNPSDPYFSRGCDFLLSILVQVILSQKWLYLSNNQSPKYRLNRKPIAKFHQHFTQFNHQTINKTLRFIFYTVLDAMGLQINIFIN